MVAPAIGELVEPSNTVPCIRMFALGDNNPINKKVSVQSVFIIIVV
jgi:hypothetical protein